MNPLNPVVVAHRFVRSIVRKGDHCIDATAGNGHDTLYLAGLVGEAGKVLGMDVQEKAIDHTRMRLAEHGLADRVILERTGHERLAGRLLELGWKNVRLVMFNLGYLPGSDKAHITRPETTLRALDASLESLSAEGALSVVVYRGHPGGLEEFHAVNQWFAGVDPNTAFRLNYERGHTGEKRTPVFFWLRRRRG